jgi:hypothetical protein
MKNIISALVSLTLLGSLSVGCAKPVDTSSATQATKSDGQVCDSQAGDHEYVFSAGSAQIARVVRSIRNDGSETLSGVSKLSRGTLTEYAELAPNGQLVYAHASFVGANGMQRRVLVDAKIGLFYVEDAEGGAWHSLPADAPWVLAGISNESGKFALETSPVSAWIAAKAAKQATNLRLVDVKSRESFVALADQYVVEGEGNERFIVTGSSAITANEEFISSLGDEAKPSRLAINSLRPKRTAQR